MVRNINISKQYMRKIEKTPQDVDWTYISKFKLLDSGFIKKWNMWICNRHFSYNKNNTPELIEEYIKYRQDFINVDNICNIFKRMKKEHITDSFFNRFYEEFEENGRSQQWILSEILRTDSSLSEETIIKLINQTEICSIWEILDFLRVIYPHHEIKDKDKFLENILEALIENLKDYYNNSNYSQPIEDIKRLKHIPESFKNKVFMVLEMIC